MRIEDGKGRSYEMGVDEDGRALVVSKTNPRLFYVSRDKGESFTLTSFVTNAAAGSYVAYIKNKSTTKLLFVNDMHTGSVNAALFKLWKVTGDASGTPIDPENLNLTSGRSADADCFGDAAVAGVTPVGRSIIAPRLGAFGHDRHNFGDSLILGPGNAIAVEYDTGTTGNVEVELTFHFEAIDRDK